MTVRQYCAHGSASGGVGCYAYDRQYRDGDLTLDKGSGLGTFRLGSTVVLVFEAPDSFSFAAGVGEKIRVGQRLCPVES